MCLEVTQCLVSTCSNESPRLQILIPPHLDDDTREAVFLCAAHLKISPTKYDLVRQCRGLEIASSEVSLETTIYEGVSILPYLGESSEGAGDCLIFGTIVVRLCHLREGLETTIFWDLGGPGGCINWNGWSGETATSWGGSRVRLLPHVGGGSCKTTSS